jgi:hypothetical protein
MKLLRPFLDYVDKQLLNFFVVISYLPLFGTNKSPDLKIRAVIKTERRIGSIINIKLLPNSINLII